MYSSENLKQISLVTANFGDRIVFREVLLDWFNFLGGKPGEVTVVDCGSDLETQQLYWQMFQERLIDKLQMIQPDHEDNEGGTQKCYIKQYASGVIASKPYVLFFMGDTLPYRKGHETWLDEAIEYLNREDVFSIGGSSNLPAKHHDAWDGWYFSGRWSLNFSLMKREKFMAAMHEFAHDYIMAGFKGINPASVTGQSRFLIEVACEKYIERHQQYTLCKAEDLNWTVFHTNAHNERLQQTRQKYLARQDIARFIDIGNADESKRRPENVMYYGSPSVSILKRLRIAVGKTAIGPYWRSLKQWLRQDRQSAYPKQQG